MAQGLEAVAELQNVYLDPCSSFPDADKIHRAVQTVGAGRVVFGSDANLLNPAFIWGLVQDAGLSQDEVSKSHMKMRGHLLSARHRWLLKP